MLYLLETFLLWEKNSAEKIKSAGFALAVVDGNLQVSPASRLTAERLTYIKTHKAEIVAALAANDAGPDPLTVEIFTPSGTPMTIRADSAEHAEWLKRMNPMPATPAKKPAALSATVSETYPEAPHEEMEAGARVVREIARATAANIQPIESETYPNA